MEKLSRRSLLTAAGAAAISLPGAAVRPLRPEVKRAKNIIFCVSDGMSAGVPSMLHHCLQMIHGKSSVWHELSRHEAAVNGFMDTCSLSSMVTDSAAAASSWGAGVRVMNGAINTLPGGIVLTPLYDILGADGMKRGLVTTATITHATPSGFAVAVANRGSEGDIAKQYLERGVEILMGGGTEFFDPASRSDKFDLWGDYAKKGYKVCKNRADLMAAKGSDKIVGTYGKGQLPFTVDQMNSAELKQIVPTLAEMTVAAIESLKKSPKGFVLQIEGARVDHAAHPNDLAGLLFDQWAFEDAVDEALKFAMADGETLVVVTSDHGNANPGITGNAGYGEKNGLHLLMGMKSSYEAMRTDLAAADTAAKLQDVIEGKLGIKLETASAEAVVAAAKGASPVSPFGNYRFPTATLAMALGTHTGVGWTSGSHTSDWTQVTAIGPGSEQFNGVIQNTDVFTALLSVRGLKHKNRSLTLAEAQAAMAEKPMAEETDLHWV